MSSERERAPGHATPRATSTATLPPVAPAPADDVYGEMLDLAEELGALNLAQGYPEDPPLADMLDAAAGAVRAGDGRYGPFAGSALLREELARRAAARGLAYDPESEVTVTAGCTEAVAVALLAAARPGCEVLTLEPFYDSYPAITRLAGAHLVPVPLAGLGGNGPVELDLARLRAAVTPATRVVLLNAPHNPTGFTLSPETAAGLAALAVEHDLLVVTDEVYEEHTYDAAHQRLAAFPGMRERTLSCSSASKMLSAGGWRVGWVYAPAPLSAALREHHRVLTFSTQTPLQAGVAAGLRRADADGSFDRMRADYRRRRDLLAGGLADAGLDVWAPPGGYFVVADVAAWTRREGVVDLARRLAREAGVVALPLTDFFATPERAGTLLRFAFCKPPAVLEKAVAQLRRFAGAGA